MKINVIIGLILMSISLIGLYFCLCPPFSTAWAIVIKYEEVGYSEN